MEPFSASLALCAGNSPVNSPQKCQWRGALMFSMICALTNGWVNNRDAGVLRRHRVYYDVIVMMTSCGFQCLSARRGAMYWLTSNSTGSDTADTLRNNDVVIITSCVQAWACPDVGVPFPRKAFAFWDESLHPGSVPILSTRGSGRGRYISPPCPPLLGILKMQQSTHLALDRPNGGKITDFKCDFVNEIWLVIKYFFIKVCFLGVMVIDFI